MGRATAITGTGDQRSTERDSVLPGVVGHEGGNVAHQPHYYCDLSHSRTVTADLLTAWRRAEVEVNGCVIDELGHLAVGVPGWFVTGGDPGRLSSRDSSIPPTG